MQSHKTFFQKKAILIAVSLWFGLLATNIWIAMHKQEGFGYKRFATYDELYVPLEKQFIREVQFIGDTVVISFAHVLTAGSKWPYVVDDSTNYEAIVKGNQALARLERGIHRYTFQSIGTNQPSIDLWIDYECTSPTQTANNCLNELLYSNIPILNIEPKSFQIWWSKQSFSAKQLAGGMTMLSTVRRADESRKALAVAAILDKMNHQDNGEPWADSLVYQLSPDSLIRRVIYDGNHVDCGEFTWFGHYLFNALEIPNRSVSLNANRINYRTGVHYLLEVYLPQRQEWGVIDGLLKLYLPQDSSGRMLNAADIHKLMASGSGLKEFSAVRIVNGEPKLVPLSNWYSMLRLYYANPYSNLNYWDTQKPFEEMDSSEKQSDMQRWIGQ
jgi:hypothetical protein